MQADNLGVSLNPELLSVVNELISSGDNISEANQLIEKQITKKVKREPVDIVVESRHYQQALSFYFDMENGIITKANRRLNQLIKRIVWFRLNIQEIIQEIVIPKTAKILAIHEKKPYENLEGYVSVCIKREILKYKQKNNRYYRRFQNSEEDLNKIIDYRTPIGGSAGTTGIAEVAAYGEIGNLIFRFLSHKINPIYLKVYELFYLEGKTDAEIGEIIKIPIKRLKKMRHKIKCILIENKYEILTACNLTEDDLRCD